jgi:hypothetical protein
MSGAFHHSFLASCAQGISPGYKDVLYICLIGLIDASFRHSVTERLSILLLVGFLLLVATITVFWRR